MPDRFGEALAGEHGGADLPHHRTQLADVLVAGEQLEAVVEARARLEQQREVAREDRDVLVARRVEGGERELQPPPAPSSIDVSIGNRPRNSMRCATSSAFAAASDPLTISPLWVRAR